MKVQTRLILFISERTFFPRPDVFGQLVSWSFPAWKRVCVRAYVRACMDFFTESIYKMLSVDLNVIQLIDELVATHH